ncbi:hypothetical protein HD806DRAFT_425851 [Xylariaceae sp. AK1471]|nr:hypothetical protein HD806DRAFT_425851 [Xylariaceae sp. AK1471]
MQVLLSGISRSSSHESTIIHLDFSGGGEAWRHAGFVGTLKTVLLFIALRMFRSPTLSSVENGYGSLQVAGFQVLCAMPGTVRYRLLVACKGQMQASFAEHIFAFTTDLEWFVIYQPQDSNLDLRRTGFAGGINVDTPGRPTLPMIIRNSSGGQSVYGSVNSEVVA